MAMNETLMKVIKENNIYKRVLEYYISKYGNNIDDPVIKKSLEKLADLEKEKLDLQENINDGILINKDLEDYMFLHLLLLNDYASYMKNELDKTVSLVDNMKKLLETLKKRGK